VQFTAKSLGVTDIELAELLRMHMDDPFISE